MATKDRHARLNFQDDKLCTWDTYQCFNAIVADPSSGPEAFHGFDRTLLSAGQISSIIFNWPSFPRNKTANLAHICANHTRLFYAKQEIPTWYS